jgi:hypothetical protein
MGKAIQGSVSDQKQVKKAARSEAWLAQRRQNDWRAIVAMPEGRRVLWSLLEQCHVFRSIMETNARIYYNAGIQDFGRTIIKEITDADPTAWITMQIEAGEVELDAPPATGVLLTEQSDDE